MDTKEHSTIVSVETAAHDLVNAITKMVHSVIHAKTGRIYEQDDLDDIEDSEQDDLDGEVVETTGCPECDTRAGVRTAEYRADDREAAARAEVARATIERQIPNGESVRYAGTGSGRTYGEGALPQAQFHIRGAKIIYPDSLRTELARMFREEPAIDEIHNIILGGDETVTFSARRSGDRQIVISSNQFQPTTEGYVISVDDLAEAEVPL